MSFPTAGIKYVMPTPASPVPIQEAQKMQTGAKVSHGKEWKIGALGGCKDTPNGIAFFKMISFGAAPSFLKKGSPLFLYHCLSSPGLRCSQEIRTLHPWGPLQSQRWVVVLGSDSGSGGLWVMLEQSPTYWLQSLMSLDSQNDTQNSPSLPISLKISGRRQDSRYTQELLCRTFCVSLTLRVLVAQKPCLYGLSICSLAS